MDDTYISGKLRRGARPYQYVQEATDTNPLWGGVPSTYDTCLHMDEKKVKKPALDSLKMVGCELDD